MAEVTFKSIKLPNMSDPARVPETATEFNPSVSYSVGDLCTYQGKLYRCKTAHAAAAWNSAHFEQTNVAQQIKRVVVYGAQPSNPGIGDLWIDNNEDSPVYNVDAYPTANSTNAVQSGGVRLAIDSLNGSKANSTNIAGDFSTSATYLVGDYVLKNGQFYKCVVQHNPGAWVSGHFRATSVGTEINSREGAVASATYQWLDDHPNAGIHLTEGCVQTGHLADGSVTEPKILNGSVTEEKIPAGTIKVNHLNADFILGVSNGGLGSNNPATGLVNIGAQSIINKATGTLTGGSTAWVNNSQNLAIPAANGKSFTSASEFVSSPADAASWKAASDAMLFPPTAGNGQLQFTCETVPDNSIKITVYWW